MTMPEERTRAILQTRDFLQRLTRHKDKAVQQEAERLLRHYPVGGDVNIAHHAIPMWFGPVVLSKKGRE